MLRRKPFALPYPEAVPRLAAILRGAPPPETVSRELADAALYHGVAGHLLAAFERPVAAPEALVDAYTRAALRSALLRRTLPAIVSALEAAGASPVLLKGPTVADRFYPDASLRTFADLDLLVPRSVLPVAVAALTGIGFAAREEFRPGFAEAFGHDVHLVGPREQGRVDVELHWRIGDDPVAQALDHARLAGRGAELDVGGTRVRVPAAADLLLVLAVHLLSDRAKRLIWVQDLVLVSEAVSDDDWNPLFAGDLGWVLHRALDYAAALLAYDRPRPLPPGPPPRWGPLRAVETLDMRASPHVGRLALLGWRGRARYLRDVLVPTRAGLEGTVGGDGAAVWRLAARHAARALMSLAPRRTGAGRGGF
jgi:Uncharacterised nucleotidyltransferase